MTPSSPEDWTRDPNHWPDFLSYCCPVVAMVFPGREGKADRKVSDTGKLGGLKRFVLCASTLKYICTYL